MAELIGEGADRFAVDEKQEGRSSIEARPAFRLSGV
jgi:hypothetical protein